MWWFLALSPRQIGSLSSLSLRTLGRPLSSPLSLRRSVLLKEVEASRAGGICEHPHMGAEPSGKGWAP